MSESDKVNILLVDDQPGKLLTYEAILGELGENLIKADSARAALEHLLKSEIAVVLVDVCMPDLDGFELASLIRQHPRHQKTAVILVSAVLLNDDARLKGFEHGAVDYVPVPVVPEILRARVAIFAELYRKTHQLERMNRELEQRVAERTHELEAAAVVLKDAKEAAEAASRSKDRFLAVLSHELRTPLTPVLMTVASLECDPALSSEVREDLAMIRRNVELETKLIDDLLDLSHITSGKLRLQTQSVDVNDTIRHVCGICRSQFLEKSIRVNLDLSEQIEPVAADPARLQQILWNVLKNAAKFTKESGEIYVSSGQSDDGMIVVKIRDTGIGIAPEVLPRIFDAFEQGDARIARQFGGLGLGLAISKALVDLHNGSIVAESEGPGKGSTFTIQLAAQVPSVAVQPKQSEPPANRPKGQVRLLVVEDDPDTSKALRRLLQSAGYAVQTANCVADALALAKNESFDVLVSDLDLPDATGYDLMREVKSAYALKGIAMSGFGMDEDIRRSREAGFSHHLVKPMEVAQLDQVIRRVVANGHEH